MLIKSGVCNESQIEEIGIHADAPLEIQLCSNGKAQHMAGEGNLHWFFSVALTNEERYAIDLCVSKFSPMRGADFLPCIAPLEEHARRLWSRTDGTVRGCIKSFGHHHKTIMEDTLEAPPEEIAKAMICEHDVHYLARKLALKHLEEASQHWLRAQSMTWNKALGLPGPKFAHIFCTIVWPIELMARERRKREADPLTIMCTIMSGAEDLSGMGL